MTIDRRRCSVLYWHAEKRFQIFYLATQMLSWWPHIGRSSCSISKFEHLGVTNAGGILNESVSNN